MAVSRDVSEFAEDTGTTEDNDEEIILDVLEADNDDNDDDNDDDDDDYNKDELEVALAANIRLSASAKLPSSI